MKKSDKTGLAQLLEHGLKDMYYAEKKIYRSLPTMIKATQSAELGEALSAHREETAGQIEILEGIFVSLEIPARGQKCDAIDGILDEASSILEEFGKGPACDAAIVFAAQSVEHYEWTRYGSLRQFALELGLEEVAAQLQSIRDQESAADEKLTSLAEDHLNAEANVMQEAESTSKRRVA